MKRIARIFRIVPLAFFCALFAYAALSVQRNRAAAEDIAPLPSRIGQVETQPSFMQETFQEMSNMWTDLYIVFAPGMLPTPVTQTRQNPHSLGALKTRTRFHSQGRNPDGSMKVNF